LNRHPPFITAEARPTQLQNFLRRKRGLNIYIKLKEIFWGPKSFIKKYFFWWA
jgi:hypothetical protein